MRNNVIFTYPQEFVPVSDLDGVLSVDGAQWFAEILKRAPELKLEDELSQEDWGVIVFAARKHKSFEIGISMWPEGEHAWLAHFHHDRFAWIQRFSSSGKAALDDLIQDVHTALKAKSEITSIKWFEESEMMGIDPKGHPEPV